MKTMPEKERLSDYIRPRTPEEKKSAEEQKRAFLEWLRNTTEEEWRKNLMDLWRKSIKE